MSSTSIDVTVAVIDNEGDFGQATSNLMQDTLLMVDCKHHHPEGDEEKLSLLSLGSASRIYIFDIVFLTEKNCNLRPLFDILSSKKIQKIFYDGRILFNVLKSCYSVTMKNNLDLQVADIESRIIREEKWRKQLARIERHLDQEIDAASKASRQSHALQSFDECKLEHQIPVGDLILPSSWMIRPLSHRHQQCVVDDSNALRLLFRDFQKRGYLTDGLSARSVAFLQSSRNNLRVTLYQTQVSRDALKSILPDPTSLPHRICASVDSLDAAVRELRKCEAIVVHTQGENLGLQGSIMSVMMIYKAVSFGFTRGQTEDAPFIYLFDILNLGRIGCSFRPISDLLSLPNIRKFFFDGRYDYSALHSQGLIADGNALNNVVDLQLTEVQRQISNMSQSRQFLALQRRLGLSKKYIESNATVYRHVHVLPSFAWCISYFKLGRIDNQGQGLDTSLWGARPLAQPLVADLLSYGFFLDRLVGRLSGFIRSSDDLQERSRQYVSVWGNRAPGQDDSYRRNPLLPLEIVDTPPANSAKKECTDCHRFLTRFSFPERVWDIQGMAVRHCFVCVAVKAWKDHAGTGTGKPGKNKSTRRRTQNTQQTQPGTQRTSGSSTSRVAPSSQLARAGVAHGTSDTRTGAPESSSSVARPNKKKSRKRQRRTDYPSYGSGPMIQNSDGEWEPFSYSDFKAEYGFDLEEMSD